MSTEFKRERLSRPSSEEKRIEKLERERDEARNGLQLYVEATHQLEARCAVLVEALTAHVNSYGHAVGCNYDPRPSGDREGQCLARCKLLRAAIASTTNAEREMAAYKRAWERVYGNSLAYGHVRGELDAILKEEQSE